MAAPAGFVKADDRYEKDPDRRVQEAIKLAFDEVKEVGSTRQALCWFYGSGGNIAAAKTLLCKERGGPGHHQTNHNRHNQPRGQR